MTDIATTDKRYMSRKFAFSAIVWLAGTIGWGIQWMSADQWISFSTWILGLYVAGNVSDSFVTGMTKIVK